MTPKELREDAIRWADRVLRNEAGYDQEYIAAAKFIRHELAEHHEDDDEPITVEWLESLGFVKHTEGYFAGYMILGDVADCLAPFPVLYSPEGDCWEYGEVPLTHQKTRGQLRRLLDALGITTKEKA